MDQSHPPSYDEATHPSFICASQYLQTRLFTPLFRIISISTPSIDDLPFDQSLENYEVMQSDWYTFVNCLVDLEGPPYRQRMVHFWNQRFFNPRRLEIELCADSGSTPQRHIAVGCGYQDFTSRAHTKSQTDILRHQNLWRLAFTYCKTALSRNALSRILSKKKKLEQKHITSSSIDRSRAQAPSPMPLRSRSSVESLLSSLFSTIRIGVDSQNESKESVYVPQDEELI